MAKGPVREIEQIPIEFDPNTYHEVESKEVTIERSKLFIESWKWVQKNVKRLVQLKGWSTLNNSDGEQVALIHSEISECLEACRKGNPQSKKIPEISEAEEELADAIIRIMDWGSRRKWKIAKAVILKMEYNKTRPYRHGKRF